MPRYSSNDTDYFSDHMGKRNRPYKIKDEKTPDEPEFDTLFLIIKGVEEVLYQNNLVLTPDKKTQLIKLLYNHYAKTDKKVEKEAVIEYLRMVSEWIIKCNDY